MKFFKKYKTVREEKDSILCVGLDPALPSQRRSKVIIKKYPGDQGDVILQFCLDIVNQVADHCCAIKINSQYVLFALSPNKIETLTKQIKDYGLLCILDHKLSDIGSSNDSALYWMEKLGFDALTYSPYAGNIREATEMAHRRNLGIFVLDLMSNPEAEGFQKKTRFTETPLFIRVAEAAYESRSDGLVAGATNHTREVDIPQSLRVTGDDRIILFPGIGSQGGDAKKILSSAGENILINVSRGIIYSKDPGKIAKQFNSKLR